MAGRVRFGGRALPGREIRSVAERERLRGLYGVLLPSSDGSRE